jgi:hypothetical protein
MNRMHRALRFALLLGAALAAPGTGAAADRESGIPAAPPIVAEHKYRMMARVRPLLFWMSKDDVGGARVSWRGDTDGAFGLDLLIGSDPQRAPRQINRWGYIAEQVRGGDARVIGVMKQSNEQTMAEAESGLGKEGSQGGYVFRAIQGSATAAEARAGVTTIRVPRDLTFHDIDPLLSLINSAQATADSRSVALPGGTRSGFLVALSDLVKQSVDAYAKRPGSSYKASAPLSFVYFGTFYDLAMKSNELMKTTTIDGKRYSNVARADFEIKNRSNGETTKFQITFGIDGALAGIPVHAIYQPRWWFEVQLFLDERVTF